jgi:hypothetical protein
VRLLPPSRQAEEQKSTFCRRLEIPPLQKRKGGAPSVAAVSESQIERAGREHTMNLLDLYNCAAPQEPLQALCASTKRLYGPG